MNKSLLPSSDKIMPYMKRIDKSRWYSNFGELNAEYQSRLGDMFGAPCITGSNATSLITATLMALDLPKGSLVAMPSWTFPATAAAVVSAGMVPFFNDVLSEDNPILVLTGHKIYKAIVMVAPFGMPFSNIGLYDKVAEISGIPIIIDAAAGFDAFSTVCKPGRCPVIISTHATKAMGTGEGGFVTCHDKPFLEKVRRITNFGLTPDRYIEYTGLNAKFSEYHAAVGLAGLDEWPEKRMKLLEAVKSYGVNYAVTQVPVRGHGKMMIYGCHIYDAYKDCPRSELPITDELIKNIGVIMVGVS